MSEKNPYPWTTCRYCGKPLESGTPRPFCNECSEKFGKQELGRTKVKGEVFDESGKKVTKK